jgi:predicted RNA-binding protein with PUA-like domain
MVNYWIFQTNRKYYEIDKELRQERLSENERDDDYKGKSLWPAKQHINEIKNGDCAFLWVTFPGSKANQRGIFGILEILSDQEPRSDNFRKYWKRDEDADAVIPRVEYKYNAILKSPFFESEIKKTDGLSNLSICRTANSHEGTNFPVKQEEARIILREIKNNNL